MKFSNLTRLDSKISFKLITNFEVTKTLKYNK